MKRPRRKSGGSPPGSPLEPIDEIIRRVFTKGKFGGSAQASELWSRWKEIVGEDVAEHCFPEKIKDGKLYIKADSPVWRQQLDLLKEEITERINATLDDVTVKKLAVR